ncbi:hypothetical protein BKA63DRAFT_482726 [Paraphoma chrysanthemicola]|nr:hypothetical protein BKA63DRAFT_482726 [Paraphoma chrysanthemicola]
MPDALAGSVIITGAASGIGQGVAVAFAQAGCRKLLLGDINETGLQATRDLVLTETPEADVVLSYLDVSEESSVNRFVEKCVARFGRLDYACNVAGICPARTPVVDLDVETYDKVVAVNLRQTFLCHRAELKQMLKQPLSETGFRGSIVSTSSMAGLNASPGASPYCSTKFGIIGLVKTDSMDYGARGIRINAVSPGFTDTPALHAISTAEQRMALSKNIPLKRLGQAVDVGRTFAFLCSKEASYIHGATYLVDGGAMTYRR